MAGKSSQSNNRGTDLFGLFVSGKTKEYHTAQFAAYTAPTGLTATGGIISDYTSGSDVYRAHIFTASGALNVTELGTFGDTVEYLVVGGGGGSGFGGGGAGGLKSNSPEMPSPRRDSAFPVSTSPGSYTVAIGGEDFQVVVRGDQPDQIQCLVPLPQMVADGVEEDLLGIHQILELVELVDLVVVADTTQVVAVLVMLAVLLQIVIKDLLEEVDINLEVTMAAVAEAVPVVLEVMLQLEELVDTVVQD